VSGARRVWIDPHDCGLVTVEAAERERREAEERRRRAEIERQQEEERARRRRTEAEARKRRQEAGRKEREEAEQRRREYEERQRRWKQMEKKEQSHQLAVQPKPEILLPDAQVPTLPAIDTSAIPVPDLSGIEEQIRQAAKMLDLRAPEGMLDRWFGRINHRIAAKTERAELLVGYISVCASIMELSAKAIDAAARVQRARYQLHVDRLSALHALLTHHYQLECARRDIIRRESIDDAKAREVVADFEAKIREHGLRGRPAPPPPPPPPPVPPVDETARKKEEARRARKEMQELELDERAEAAEFEQDLVSKARTEAIKIYQNINMLAGDRFERIRRVLESYKVPVTILPAAIQEFMEEEEEASNL